MTHSLPESPATTSAELTALVERLEDPRVAAGLQNLLDHVDLLAVLVIGLDGFIGRSEVIGDALVDSVSDMRLLADGAKTSAPIDVAATVSSLLALSSALPKLTPTLTRVADEDLLGGMLDSGIVSAESLAHIGMLATAVNEGAAQAVSEPIEIKGAISMYRQLKDPDIARGLGYTLSILKAVGHQLASDN
jgi:uncharacterized protein YjgD (DUF1641 family)